MEQQNTGFGNFIDAADVSEEVMQRLNTSTTQRADPFADEQLPFINGDLKDDLAKLAVPMTIEAVREGDNTYKSKTSAYWYIDVLIDMSHKNFSKLRDREKLLDGRGTLSFAKNGKDGSPIGSRATQFTKVKTLLPYSYVVLDRSSGFDKFRTVKE